MGQLSFARPQRRAFETGPKYATDFLTVPHDPPLSVVVLSDKMAWYELHWYSGKHCPCTAPTGACYLCDQLHLPTTAQGYCFVRVEGKDKTGVLHLTGDAVDRCPPLARVTRLRGCRLTISRKNKKPHGQIIIDVVGDTFDVSKLPACSDIEEWMHRALSKHALPVNPKEKG